MPIYPMIDDRERDAVQPRGHRHRRLGPCDNIEAWALWYLGGKDADQYAAPARAEDLAGLPPAYLDVGTVDLFRDEDIAFAQRLMQAGVPTELHVHPGSYHASEMFAPEAAPCHSASGPTGSTRSGGPSPELPLAPAGAP